MYHATPHATANIPGSELFLGRCIWTILDLLKLDRETHVDDKHSAQDQLARKQELDLDQKVMARNWSSGPYWVPGVIVKQLGPPTFQVRTQQNHPWKRHADHLRKFVGITKF